QQCRAACTAAAGTKWPVGSPAVPGRTMMLASRLQMVQQRIAGQLQQHLQALQPADPRLAEAMQYRVLNGGKRLRPLQIYATCEARGGTTEAVDAAAVAMVMLDGYSLVHDALPAMDDDDLRRGNPTCHIAFDEGAEVLTGDGLLTA